MCTPTAMSCIFNVADCGAQKRLPKKISFGCFARSGKNQQLIECSSYIIFFVTTCKRNGEQGLIFLLHKVFETAINVEKMPINQTGWKLWGNDESWCPYLGVVLHKMRRREQIFGGHFLSQPPEQNRLMWKKKCKDILGKEKNRQLAMAPSENNVQGAGRVLTRHQS